MGAAHQRYGGLSAAGKKALVDELVVITGYHRKSVLRALNRKPISADAEVSEGRPQRHHRCRYGPEVMEALVPLWEASDRLCGKRLQALLPLLLESLECHGHLALDLEVREKLLTISSATIDRLLAPVRETSPGNGWRRPPRARSAVQRRTQVRTFNGWGEVKEAGWLEIDLVAHCGKWMEGRFLWTLVATDMATGWSECLPLLSRDGTSVMAALRMLEELLPFPLRGIDVDNDGAFLNAPLEQWCEKHQPRIELTRSRAYQSNDQAWVEQKNGMLVRRVVGYERLEGLVAAELLGELYGGLRLFTNLYQPSFKLKETIREGAKLKRRHHPPRTPQQRLLALGQLRDAQQKALEEQQRSSDPVALLETVRRCQASLASLSVGQQHQEQRPRAGAVDPEQAGKEQRTLSRFLRNLQLLWKESQPLPEPREKRRYTPRQRTLFAEHQEQIEHWLEGEASMHATEILRRLMALAPGTYHEGQLRSMERRVKEWRTARAERLLGSLRSAGKGAQTGETPNPVATPKGGNS
ncbi:MAG: transposase family protein [Cyanobium sp.]